MSAFPDNPYTSRLSSEGQIRLLKLQPGTLGNREVACTLEIVNLNDTPSYVALSYTWGPPTAEAADMEAINQSIHSITCDGNAIQITKNLSDFLQRAHLEPELQSQRFWIDSICINQQDALERSHQVSLMASIYHSADFVIAWLGEEDVDTEESFALISTLATLCKDCLNRVSPKNRASEAFENTLGPLAGDRAWNSLRRFWTRSYFKRAWIIQEVTLAKKVAVKCGSHLLEWDDVVKVSRYLTVTPWTRLLNSGVQSLSDREYSNHAQPLYLNVGGHHKESGKRESGKSHFFLYALMRARRFECSDPRDKVYSLLGLEEHYTKEKARLRPVYGDRSVVDTYVSAAIQILQDTGDLLLLAQAEGQDFQKVEGLPSWVPDWSCAKGLGLGLAGYLRFAAAGSVPRKLDIDGPSRSLRLRGILLDRVVQIGESKPEALHRTPAYFPGWLSIVSSLPLVYHTGQPRGEVFWRTLITDTASRLPHPTRHPAADEYQEAFRDWAAQIIMGWTDQPPSAEAKEFLAALQRVVASDETGVYLFAGEQSDSHQHTKTITDSVDYVPGSGTPPDAYDYDALLNHSAHTRLLKTNANYLGIATTSVREGDSVWIVPGSRVPLIFREAGSPGEYHLVGGAYIHGFMHGEALVSSPDLVNIKVL